MNSQVCETGTKQASGSPSFLIPTRRSFLQAAVVHCRRLPLSSSSQHLPSITTINMPLSGSESGVLLVILKWAEPRMRSTGNLALILILVLGVIVVNRWQRKPKLPKVPILKLSPLPGKAGAAEDVAAFVRNGRDVMQAGYDQYSKHGQNYLLR